MSRRIGFSAVAAALSLCSTLCGAAFAHGGRYQGEVIGGDAPGGQVPPGEGGEPDGTPGGGRGAKSLTVSRDFVTPSRWWARHRTLYLRLGAQLRRADVPLTLRDGERLAEDPRVALRERLVPVLIGALDDPEFDVRSSAAVALGRAGDARARPALRKAAAEDPEGEVRQAACLALGLLGYPEDLPYLAALLEDPGTPDLTRAFAALGLGLSGGPDAAAALRRAVGGKAAPGERAVDDAIRGAAVLALGETRDPSAVEALRAVLKERSLGDGMTGLVAGALARTGDQESLDWIASFLRSDASAVERRGAAAALARGLRADDGAVVGRLFHTARDDKDPTVRRLALLTLGQTGDPAIGRRLAALEPRTDRADRSTLMLALGLSRAPEAASILRAEFEDDRADRFTVTLALGLHGQASNAKPLVKWLESDAHEARDVAVLALGLLGAEQALPLVEKELDRDDRGGPGARALIGAGLLRMPGLRARLETRLTSAAAVRARADAALVLGELRELDAADALVASYLKRGEEPIVRGVAVVALGMLLDSAPHPRHLEFGFHRDPSVVLPALAELLQIL